MNRPDPVTINYFNLSNSATFETQIWWILLIENIYSPQLMSFDTTFQ